MLCRPRIAGQLAERFLDSNHIEEPVQMSIFLMEGRFHTICFKESMYQDSKSVARAGEGTLTQDKSTARVELLHAKRGPIES
jgi:hypothetical protein